MDNTLVVANRLKVSYGHRVALTIDNLAISKGAGIIGLFGPNGAGKSTLLRTLVGDIAQYEGSLTTPCRSDIAYLPDEPFVYPWMSISQCASLFTSRHADFRNDVFEEFLAGSNLTSKLKVSELSKGMSERLHLALVMSRTPLLYILDEPLGGVDPLTRDHLLDLICTLRHKEAPLILSTHLINGIDRIFNDIILISEGKLLIHSSAQALRELGDGDLELAYKRSVTRS